MSEPQLPAKYDRLVWIDLEMTGLDPARHVIVEIAAVVTDAQLNILGEGVDIVVHASEEELAQMDDFVANMHASSGLTEEITASTISLAEAEQTVLELIAEHCDPEHPAPLAGNSIATDRAFIKAHMPALDAALHYRMVDVSSVKELARRWQPRVYYHQPDKGLAHRALADIVESIRELDYYRRALFVADPGPTSENCGDAAAQAVERYREHLGQ
ncbi:oligoribonuclease [Corynebacterium sp. TAE3-ERU2]|uniref:oligoribonuclease n=1 Tax=Corynebacterium sp. TAE3-ERU2 TaxID=2849497 RepID=UPI001C45997E|nr:oligoribonuclease [Corynebacterium sp. TAE3-ERU2]MBV7301502.1 oligoribonuclease [Corynebacterium sp. TAE3-ERU2]